MAFTKAVIYIVAAGICAIGGYGCLIQDMHGWAMLCLLGAVSGIYNAFEALEEG